MQILDEVFMSIECTSDAKLGFLTRAEMLETYNGSYGNSEF